MMNFFKNLSFASLIVSNLYMSFTCSCIHAAIFEIFNNCTYTIWAATVPGGGRELLQGQSWVVNTDPNFADTGRIWARTNCNFDDNGMGKCDSGDCGGVLYCASSNNVTTPFTLAEYAISGLRNVEGFEISLMNGFNVPMEFKEVSGECSTMIKCTGDINRWCPTELRDPGGCNHPCTVFNNDQFCCFHSRTCNPSVYSKFLKDLCPHVSTYPGDFTNTLTGCSYGTNYQVMFCPSST